MDAISRPVKALGYPPTPEEARARLERLSPQAYARARNHHEGPAARLSPYLTHGMLSVPEVIDGLSARVRLRSTDKLVFELAWREYFLHLWSHFEDDIFVPRYPAPAGSAYGETIPEDVLGAATGVPAIDLAVKALYESGYLHNHARMWLASYLVHLRKVDWRVGAAWMYGHLIDGDLGSNFLSWQWVAGTLTGQPYLFNAGNVMRYAPLWASPGTAIDRNYGELRRMAAGGTAVPPEPVRPAPVAAAPLTGAPGLVTSIEPGTIAGRAVHLMHPWALGPVPAGHVAIGVLHAPFHERFGWSALRWEFVLRRMLTACNGLFVGDLASLGDLLTEAAAVTTEATRNPGYREGLARLAPAATVPDTYFGNPPEAARSFSEFWTKVRGRVEVPRPAEVDTTISGVGADEGSEVAAALTRAPRSDSARPRQNIADV